MYNSNILVILLLVGTFFTSTITMLPAAYSERGDDDGRSGDENKQNVDDSSAGEISDCDYNEFEEIVVENSCVSIAATDENIVREGGTPTPDGDGGTPPPEDAELSVTKTVSCSSHLGAPSNEAVCNFALASDNFPDPSDYQITVTGNNLDPSNFVGSESPEVVSIGPGEYTVSEILADTSALQQGLGASFIDNRSVFEGDCINSFGGTTSTTGTIAAGQSQECNIGNEINIFGGTVPGD
jgi:hypothetical protein